MKSVYMVRVGNGIVSQPYEVIARSAEEALKKATAAAKRDGLLSYRVRELLYRGRAI